MGMLESKYKKIDIKLLLAQESLTEEELGDVLKIIDAIIQEDPVDGLSNLDDSETILVNVLEHAKNLPLTKEQYDIIFYISGWFMERSEGDNTRVKWLASDIFKSDVCEESGWEPPSSMAIQAREIINMNRTPEEEAEEDKKWRVMVEKIKSMTF